MTFYPLLTKRILLRNLEVPLLYDTRTENLWELDEEAFNTLQYFTGTWSVEEIAVELQIDKDEIMDLINNLGIDIVLNKKIEGTHNISKVDKASTPSLRTLLIHTTFACNLTCRHCYLGGSKKGYIDPDLFKSVVFQLEKLQGLKILISGGEPLLHPKIFDILESIKKIKLRKLLLSNGTLINEEIAKQLKNLVHEVQVSIDGTDSHNRFRNNLHAFQKTIQAIKNLNKVGMDVSVATMIHSQNLAELPVLEKILKNLKIKSWTLDVPSQTGEFLKYPELSPSIEDAGAVLRKFGWGSPFEDLHNIYACGAHLCALMPNGNVTKCGFFGDEPVGNLNKTQLANCWRMIQKKFIWKQNELECTSLNCPYLQDCKGGCRFRAYVDTGRLMGIDRIKCAAFKFKY
ncbi:MAG: radical SAM protein [Promethearchaeota archaeon]